MICGEEKAKAIGSILTAVVRAAYGEEARGKGRRALGNCEAVVDAGDIRPVLKTLRRPSPARNWRGDHAPHATAPLTRGGPEKMWLI